MKTACADRLNCSYFLFTFARWFAGYYFDAVKM